MAGYIAHRMAWMMFIILGISLITFILTRMIPGDPVRFAAGLDARPEQVAELRKVLGLDRPLQEQYARYLLRMLRGDLGVSFVSRRPVSYDLRLYFPATLELVGFAVLVTAVLAIPLGALSAFFADRILDRAVLLISSLGMALPVFWLALMLQLIFYRHLGILPGSGRLTGTPPSQTTGLLTVDAFLAGAWPALLNAGHHLILPVVALALPRIAIVLRMVRASVLDVLTQEYIRTSRAKGMTEQRVLWKHALRNSLIPVVTLLGLQFGWMLGGTVIVESIFGWPGIGQYAVYGILNLDYPAIIGSTLAITAAFVLANLIADISYGWLDPQIRYG